MFGVPLMVVLVWMFILGSIFGSFIDVFVSRYNTGRSINGRSHCASCGHSLRWYELFPLFSYICLRGRCLVCGSKIPSRLLIVEIVTGLCFVGVTYLSQSIESLVFGCAFVLIGMIITLYDVKHLVIPNVFVFLLGGLAVADLALVLWPIRSVGEVLPYILSGIVAASFYAALWFVSKGEWLGLGDAKLALPLALMLSPYQTFSFVVLSFWIGAVVSVGILLLQWFLKRGQPYLQFFDIPLTMKSEVPFAPFLLIAFAAVHFFNLDVLSFFAF